MNSGDFVNIARVELIDYNKVINYRNYLDSLLNVLY